jgi:hypothetical protein
LCTVAQIHLPATSCKLQKFFVSRNNRFRICEQNLHTLDEVEPCTVKIGYAFLQRLEFLS